MQGTITLFPTTPNRVALAGRVIAPTAEMVRPRMPIPGVLTAAHHSQVSNLRAISVGAGPATTEVELKTAQSRAEMGVVKTVSLRMEEEVKDRAVVVAEDGDAVKPEIAF